MLSIVPLSCETRQHKLQKSDKSKMKSGNEKVEKKLSKTQKRSPFLDFKLVASAVYCVAVPPREDPRVFAVNPH